MEPKNYKITEMKAAVAAMRQAVLKFELAREHMRQAVLNFERAREQRLPRRAGL